jgi:UDP-GlcNAc3NAcA epimerase
MKLLAIVGARPQFIKAATVSRAMRARRHPDLREQILHTGQHFDHNMSQVFFDQLGIPLPRYNLGIASLPHGAMTGRMTEGIERVLLEDRPDWVLVYGDTNSTLAGALAAVKLQIPVAHVEAGMRSFDVRAPEEINRVVTDRVSQRLFCSTEAAVDNLRRDGLTEGVELVGDVMYDATLYYQEVARLKYSLSAFGVGPQSYALCTIHRAENADHPERLRGIWEALNAISESTPIVLPLHPRTRAVLAQLPDFRTAPGIRLIDPVSYLEMILLESHARAIITDSGGVQKEAFFHRVPCLTLRSGTEWVETVQLGWNVLCGTETARILDAWNRLGPPAEQPGETPYGDGHAADRIAGALLECSR